MVYSVGLGRKNSSLEVTPGGKSKDTGGQVLRKKEDKGSRIRTGFLLKTGIECTSPLQNATTMKVKG